LNMERIILGASSFALKLYTDTAYALNANTKLYTGIVITFDWEVTGPEFYKSQIQKVVTLSLTESELVALVDEGVKRPIPMARLLQFIGAVPVGDTALVLSDNKEVGVAHDHERRRMPRQI
jgi:hypothetical protein